MPSFHAIVALPKAIARPPCPRCGTRMMLARIEPHEPGYDLRTFECPECEYSAGNVVKIDADGAV